MELQEQQQPTTPFFGWTILGQFGGSSGTTNICLATQQKEPEQEDGNYLLQCFWKQEEVEPPQPAFSPEELLVQEHYDNNLSYDSMSCRYTVRLPRRKDSPALGDSRTQALQRFKANERLTINKGTYSKFQQVVQEYLDLGHAQPVDLSNTISDQPYYLPMHGVIKSSSSTTKLRVVFDASAKTTSGTSLNQTLMEGPTLHPTLENILLRLRSYPIALSGDVSKMYRAVGLHAGDRHLHRFLWRPTPEEHISEYEMTRVTFGVAASPHLAIRTLQQTATDHSSDLMASNHIMQSFYVDDLLAGGNSIEEVSKLMTNLCDTLAKGGFKLCKFRSSSSQVLNAIEPSVREELPVQAISDSTDIKHPKALGLIWDPQKDLMSISLNVSGTVIPTKRGIVSDISKTFDILGWMAPSTVCMKILYQKLWIAKIGWDDPAPTHLVHEHASWKNQLSVLSNVEFDRCYFRINETPLTTQLHGFSDASELAFLAVVYIRSTYSSNPPLVKLVAAKTKVAPLKKITVPRLELCGAQLLAKLLNNISIALSVPASDIYAWSDSTIVLSWLDGQAKRYKVYVGNRISTTLSLVPAGCWTHVPTTINPVDCASRGLSPSELANFTLWWKGPEFLWEEPFAKPPQPTTSSITAPEQKATGQCNVVLPSKPLFLSGRYSNYHYCEKTQSSSTSIRSDYLLSSSSSILIRKHFTSNSHPTRAEICRASTVQTESVIVFLIRTIILAFFPTDFEQEQDHLFVSISGSRRVTPGRRTTLWSQLRTFTETPNYFVWSLCFN